MKLKPLIAALAFAAAASAQAQTVFRMDFEQLDDLQEVADFYDGNGGPDYGATFSLDSLAVKSDDFGGSGSFSGQQGENALIFLQGSAVVTVQSGFTTAVSFLYSAQTGANASVRIFDANGNLLNPDNTALGSTGNDVWGTFSFSFVGTAKSLQFGGAGNQVVFDNLTIGYGNPLGDLPPPIPEPSTYGLVLLGLAGVVAVARRRRA
ncbi:MAG: PEP-CTERM sorting domain-containing protein [Aquabacterium sp.]